MRWIALVLFVALAVAGCGGSKETSTATATGSQTAFEQGQVTITTQDSDVVVPVEVATTEAQRERGLMERESLPKDAGMYFVFEGEQSGIGFWMKDTLIPLSVAVADADGKITKILDMEPCEADPCAVYGVGDFVTALEVNQGAFERWGVKVGDQMELGER